MDAQDLKTQEMEIAQKAADRETAARVELAAAIANRIATRSSISEANDAALKFLDDFANPAAPTPDPIAPAVAAPAPDVEPPVFADVSVGPVLTPESTSGGTSEVHDELDATALAPTDAG